MLELITNADIQILLWIQENIRTPWLTPIVTLLTSLGNAGILWVLLSALLLIPKKTRRIGCASFIALFASLVINNLILKNLVARTRPYDAFQELVPLIARPSDFSFSRSYGQFFCFGLCPLAASAENSGNPGACDGGFDRAVQAVCRRALSKRCACGAADRNIVRYAGAADRQKMKIVLQHSQKRCKI